MQTIKVKVIIEDEKVVSGLHIPALSVGSGKLCVFLPTEGNELGNGYKCEELLRAALYMKSEWELIDPSRFDVTVDDATVTSHAYFKCANPACRNLFIERMYVGKQVTHCPACDMPAISEVSNVREPRVTEPVIIPPSSAVRVPKVTKVKKPRKSTEDSVLGDVMAMMGNSFK